MSWIFDSIRRLQESVNRIGLGGALLTLPAPRMLSMPAPDGASNLPHEQFILMITNQDLLAVSRDLFVSGFYTEAVENAFKLLDDAVKKASNSDLHGSKLMENVFSPNSPIIRLSKLETQSERDEQSGYQRLFAGSMLGIRNPCAHSNKWIDDPKTALEVITLCQHLLSKLKKSTSQKL